MMIRTVLAVIAAIGLVTLSKCLFSSQVSCAASEPSCYSAKAEFNVTGFLSLSSSGCTSDCYNTAGRVLGAGYSVTKVCCATDLFNGARAAHLTVTIWPGARYSVTTDLFNGARAAHLSMAAALPASVYTYML